MTDFAYIGYIGIGLFWNYPAFFDINGENGFMSM